MNMIKYGSRKFWLSLVGIISMVAIPPWYHGVGIDSGITMMVLGGIAAGVSAYTGFNVLEKKWIGQSLEQKK